MLNLNKISATVQSVAKKCQDFFALTIDQEENLTKQITAASVGNLNFYILTVFSALIISLGTIVNNLAIILAGLLILPMVWPFLAVSLALIKGDRHLLGKTLLTLLKAVLLILILSFLSGLIAPNHALTSIITKGNQSSIMELLLALLGGFLAAFLINYPKFGSLVANLLIASLITPSLIRAGFSFALGSFYQAAQAGLIFLSNFTALTLAAASFFCLAGFKKALTLPVNKDRSIPWPQLFLFALIVIFFAFTFRLAEQERQFRLVKEILVNNLPEGRLIELVVSKDKQEFVLAMTLFSPNNLSSRQMDKLMNVLMQKLQRSVKLEITVIPTFQGHKTSVPTTSANPQLESRNQDLDKLRNKVFPSLP